MAHVYILCCADGSYYVGNTRSLDARLEQHFSGRGSAYTGARMPVTLAFDEEYERVDEAYAREKQIQGWSRAKREALISANFALLPELSHSAGQRDTRNPNRVL
ncbi:GIY-YIG nuclease family protein [Microterricola viridarii]|uniref:Excinuclease ABC subunit C n=1 Tax=Microterricola viridarii TaxID=412690 RepID=A0A0Y0MXA6_9MICO|nr:GIY-YIG nuclease family protein [Microterricola viridarii]AMB57569.1 excinuclease ABC subunit C [Microterricola viridarii]